VVGRSCATVGRSAKGGAVILLCSAVGRSWAVAKRSTKGGVRVPLGVPMTRKSPEGASENVKDVYWRPQEGGSDTMLNILWSGRMKYRKEKERKHM
jgi:hypothetical protein